MRKSYTERFCDVMEGEIKKRTEEKDSFETFNNCEEDKHGQ